MIRRNKMAKKDNNFIFLSNILYLLYIDAIWGSAITLWLHCGDTAITLQLHCTGYAITLRLHFNGIAITLRLHCDDNAITLCVTLHDLMTWLPIITNPPLVDFRVSLQPA